MAKRAKRNEKRGSSVRICESREETAHEFLKLTGVNWVNLKETDLLNDKM